ncbi:PadR family transcriptional regulator [uncultured Sphingomonas sp.]|uniref:PadR family transcriptional regulator n=1 Tax=uncultured Sphingomonas sp. TaxID=158754 RepID=UPI0025DBE1EA|nr:PadR family transcriptional regulator [uncultured Sphingomonas sp.]
MHFEHGFGRWFGGGGFGGGIHGLHRHGGGRGEHSRGGGGGGGRRRVFDGGELRLVLLALLEEQPRHGYDLIREVEERTGGAYVPSPGVVYPTLTMLDELGHIDEVKEAGARKRFAITEAGRTHLDEKRDEADALIARLSRLGQEESRHGAAPVKRAMMSLHMALRDALSSTQDRDMVHDVTAILDEATRKIERLER